MYQLRRGQAEQALRFWLSTWIPQHYPPDTSYDLRSCSDGTWSLTLYPTGGKVVTGTLWESGEEGARQVHVDLDT